MLFTRWVSFYLLYDRLTMLLSYAFFDTWRALSFMAFSTLRSFLLIFMQSLRLIGQEIPLVEGQPLAIVFFLVFLDFLAK